MKRRAFLKDATWLAGGIAGMSALDSKGSMSEEHAPIPQRTKEVKSRTIEFGSEKQVFIDWWFIEAGYGLAFTPAQQKERHFHPRFMPYGVKLSVISPQINPNKPIIIPDAQGDGVYINVYSTLMKDEGRYRLWYEGFQSLEPENVGLCYAESDDGKTWKKPNLGLVELNGSKQNNISFRAGVSQYGWTVFKDPSAQASERYKLIWSGPRFKPDPTGLLPPSVYGAVSPDGLRWTRLPRPLLNEHSDTQDVAAYDPVRKRYVAYLRGWDPFTVYGGRRVIKWTESEDFRNFPEAKLLFTAAPYDPPDVDVYTNAYQRWPGAARAYLMLPAFYHRASDTADVNLAVSRDGVLWFRPSKHALIPVGTEVSGYEGMVYAGVGTVPLGKGEWAFPIGLSRLTHNAIYPEYLRGREGGVWLATLREDGFMALEAESKGECWTQVISFKGSQLLVNTWARIGGRLLIELATPDGTPFPGFSLGDCDGVEGNALWGPVRWKGKSDVSTLAGQGLRLRFDLTRCRLHALRFA